MPEQILLRKFIILDPSLKNVGGHYYEYDLAISGAAHKMSLNPLIYANKACESELLISNRDIQAWFTTEWSAGRGHLKEMGRHLFSKLPVNVRAPVFKLGRYALTFAKTLRKTRHSRRDTISRAANNFGQEVIAALVHARVDARDIIFLPTIRTSELFALWKMVQTNAVAQSLTFHIVLRRDALEMDLSEDGAPGISVIFREMQLLSRGESFQFYCDTEQLCSDYRKLSEERVAFHLLPIPFPNPSPDPVSLEKWSSGPEIKLIYLGGARVEKGFHLLPKAHAALEKAYSGRIIWRLQAPSPERTEEPEVTLARRYFFSMPPHRIDIVERNLSPAEFESLLQSADIVLLPYLRQFYRARSSGILVQALAVGKPVVVPSNSWLSSQTGGAGAVEFTDDADFPRAVMQALDTLPKLRKEAKDRASNYASLHNVETLLKILQKH